MHKIISTKDGSITLFVPELNEHYHSVHGAIQESQHIFIQAGMEHFLSTYPGLISAGRPLHILEAGFGTGLNAWLTLLQASKRQRDVVYHSIEKYPLSREETSVLNYPEMTADGEKTLFDALHRSPWDTEQSITPHFTLCKHRDDFRNIRFSSLFDLVYFDAFNPEVQPHLWTAEVFGHFYEALQPGGFLVTYCVKGIVKQALRSVGFTVKRLPGPPGKREMLRATKPENAPGNLSEP